jgi:hypothetical protein
MGVVVHQHGTSYVPLAAGAQPFGPPQSGQVLFGLGSTDAITVSRPSSIA